MGRPTRRSGVFIAPFPYARLTTYVWIYIIVVPDHLILTEVVEFCVQRNAATTGSLLPVNNLSKEDGNMNDIPLIDKGVMDKPRYLYDDDEDSAKSGCFWNFFSCICS